MSNSTEWVREKALTFIFIPTSLYVFFMFIFCSGDSVLLDRLFSNIVNTVVTILFSLSACFMAFMRGSVIFNDYIQTKTLRLFCIVSLFIVCISFAVFTVVGVLYYHILSSFISLV